VHAVQLEMTQRTYMQEEPPYTFRPAQAADVRPILEEQLTLARDWAVNHARSRAFTR
jgi:N-formylglutamate amidohydrolase